MSEHELMCQVSSPAAQAGNIWAIYVNLTNVGFSSAPTALSRMHGDPSRPFLAIAVSILAVGCRRPTCATRRTWRAASAKRRSNASLKLAPTTSGCRSTMN